MDENLARLFSVFDLLVLFDFGVSKAHIAVGGYIRARGKSYEG